VLATNRATDWPSFREALRHWSFPSQNVVYADTGGTIAYMMPGLVPRRRNGDGLSPVPGWNDDFAWDGFIPFEELPVMSTRRKALSPRPTTAWPATATPTC
jgi:penicillin amidase